MSEPKTLMGFPITERAIERPPFTVPKPDPPKRSELEEIARMRLRSLITSRQSVINDIVDCEERLRGYCRKRDNYSNAIESFLAETSEKGLDMTKIGDP